MKVIIVALALLAVLATPSEHSQPLPQSVYAPFTQEEIQSVTGQTAPFVPPEHTHQKPHHKKHKKDLTHDAGLDEEVIEEQQEFTYGDDLTDEEREERKQERRRYNKIFRIGMIIGTGVLAVIIFKFCKAKRLRNRNRMMQAQQVQMAPQQQPYLYSLSQTVPVHPQAFPSAPAQHIQMGRPYSEPVAAPIVRGRVHDSFIRQQPVQPVQQVESPMQAQIRFHEAEIQRLKQMKERQERLREVEMQRVPINTTESFESQQPMNRYRNIPVGQPIYANKDANSSFASEYPEI